MTSGVQSVPFAGGPPTTTPSCFGWFSVVLHNRLSIASTGVPHLTRLPFSGQLTSPTQTTKLSPASTALDESAKVPAATKARSNIFSIGPLWFSGAPFGQLSSKKRERPQHERAQSRAFPIATKRVR